ncbi:MAG: efflux RND transporter periplasmic adaptor subunit [Acidobacteriota bacterium]|nr:efflux RND transporter periplasmic adaptor subunit [Acidobacteriota bacterium]
MSTRDHQTFRHAIAGVLAIALPSLVACNLLGDTPKGEPTVSSQAESLELRIWLDPDPPKQEGVLWIELLDRDGSQVEEAEVEVGWLMPAMGAMAEMKGDSDVERRGSGLYRAPLDLPMAGTWTVSVEGSTAESSVLAEYTLNTGTPGLREVTLREVASGRPRLPRLTDAEDPETRSEHVHELGGGEIAHYTCSMHPSVKRDASGTCPICSMDLVPVTRREVDTSVFVVDSARRQEIGVRTEPVRFETVSTEIRAVGKVTYDESRLSEVTVKYAGWIGRLHADRTGELVARGELLFELYSPELYATQEELLAALASQRAARETAAPDRADYLVEAARQRLRLWDLGEGQIAAVEKAGEPVRYLPILAPTSGYVIEKHVVQGASVAPGQTLYRLGGLETVWIEAEVYESDLPLIRIGQRAEVTLPYLPGRSFESEVSFIYPYLESGNRTGIVRLALDNPDLELKPDMYANVILQVDRGARLTVAEEAVLYAGDRRLAFVDLGEGRLEPRAVEVGARSGERVEILSGLEAGEVVVTSGNFLIAAESRLKSAAGKW